MKCTDFYWVVKNNLNFMVLKNNLQLIFYNKILYDDFEFFLKHFIRFCLMFLRFIVDISYLN